MDDETRLVPTQDARALAQGETITLAPVAVEELATKVVAALDLLAAIIPDLRTPHPRTAKNVRGARTVPREAVTSIAAMVDATPALQRMKLMATDRAREVVGSLDDYRLVAQRAELLVAQTKFTAEQRYAEVVKEAMRAFRMAVILADDTQAPELAARVEAIRKLLGRRNGSTGRRKKENEPKAE